MLDSVLLYGYTALKLFIHSGHVWCLCFMLLCARASVNMCFSLLLGISLELETLARMEALCLTVWEAAGAFCREAAPCPVRAAVCEVCFLHVLVSTFLLSIFAYSCPTGMKWYLPVVLTGIPWWLMTASPFSCAHWPLVYLLGRNVYSGHLPILNWVGLFWAVLEFEFRVSCLLGRHLPLEPLGQTWAVFLLLICKHPLYDLQTVFPFCELSFLLLDSVFWRMGHSNFH
jgi:hypothetical protein